MKGFLPENNSSHQIAKLTSKGQITVPAEVRKALH
jgi:bifunctional DNA-binding transcriptional regulator/antitoxin component of YhaV-PrlF toxin-antitoxin module